MGRNSLSLLLDESLDPAHPRIYLELLPLAFDQISKKTRHITTMDCKELFVVDGATIIRYVDSFRVRRRLFKSILRCFQIMIPSMAWKAFLAFSRSASMTVVFKPAAGCHRLRTVTTDP